MLLRRVIGDVLRARRQGQHRTLREVSTAANVSLGYLSEIERGQKEASSELLAAICAALGSQLSEVLRDVTDSLALSESAGAVLADAAPELSELAVEAAEPQPALADGVAADPVAPRTAPEEGQPVLVPSGREPAGAEVGPQPADAQTVTDGTVSVCVRRNGPLRTTLHAMRNRRPGISRTIELTRPAG